LAMGRESVAVSDNSPSLRALLADRTLDGAAIVALLAVLTGIAWLVERALRLLAGPTARFGWQAGSSALGHSLVEVVVLILALAVVVGVAGLCVNVNRFSLHAMYRDRLIRSFLGVTRRDYPKPPWPLDDTAAYQE